MKKILYIMIVTAFSNIQHAELPTTDHNNLYTQQFNLKKFLDRTNPSDKELNALMHLEQIKHAPSKSTHVSVKITDKDICYEMRKDSIFAADCLNKTRFSSFLVAYIQGCIEAGLEEEAKKAVHILTRFLENISHSSLNFSSERHEEHTETTEKTKHVNTVCADIHHRAGLHLTTKGTTENVVEYQEYSKKNPSGSSYSVKSLSENQNKCNLNFDAKSPNATILSVNIEGETSPDNTATCNANIQAGTTELSTSARVIPNTSTDLSMKLNTDNSEIKTEFSVDDTGITSNLTQKYKKPTQ